jgi:hypothetical protein
MDPSWISQGSSKRACCAAEFDAMDCTWLCFGKQVFERVGAVAEKAAPMLKLESVGRKSDFGG